MSDTDDEGRRVLKEFILKMTSFFPEMRPKITQVCDFIQQAIKDTKGESMCTQVKHDIKHVLTLYCSTVSDLKSPMNKNVS